MKKIAVAGYLFLVIFSRVFADENTNELKNICFTWQYYRYVGENNQKLIVPEYLNPSIHLSGIQTKDNNSLQNVVASFIWLSIFTGVMIDYSVNWREYDRRKQEARIYKELYGDIWEQKMERIREIEYVERGFHRKFNSDPDRIIY